jgi:hypothetical protein
MTPVLSAAPSPVLRHPKVAALSEGGRQVQQERGINFT